MTTKQEKIVQELQAAGIGADGYAHCPVDGAHFIINRPSNSSVKLWATEEVDVQVSTDASKTQAVLAVTEPDRILKSNGNFRFTFSELTEKFTTPELVIANIQPTWVFAPGEKEEERVFVPPTEAAAEQILIRARALLSSLPRDPSNYSAPRPTYTIHYDTEQTVSSSTVHLLTGIDETAHFICVLPSKAETVEEAHALLRPKTVRKDAVRQGEWFFQPVRGATHTILDSALATIKPTSFNGAGFMLEQNSSHRVTMLITDKHTGRRFCLGTVSDTRKARHHDIVLPKWHEVIRNTEITAPVGNSNIIQSRTRYWD